MKRTPTKEISELANLHFATPLIITRSKRTLRMRCQKIQYCSTVRHNDLLDCGIPCLAEAIP